MPTRSIRAVLKTEDKSTGTITKVVGALASLVTVIGAVRVATAALRETTSQLDQSSSEAARFESSMSKVNAILKLSEGSFAALTEQSKELGATTVFTATEAAQAMESLSRAGFTAREIFDSIGPALSLAAVGELEVSRAATIAADTTRQFGLETAQAAEAIDIISRAATVSSQDVAIFAEAMKFAGAGAGQLGLPLEDTAAALARLADVGLKAGIAGRPLRTLFFDLVGALQEGGKQIKDFTVELDAGSDGVLSLTELLDGLAEAGITAANAGDVFEAQQAAIVAALLKNRDATEKTLAKVKEFGGTADRIATGFLDNFAGSVRLMESAASRLRTEIGLRLNDVLRVFVDDLITPLLQKLGTLASRSGTLRNIFIDTGIAVATAGNALAAFSLIAAITARQVPGLGTVVGKLGEEFKNMAALVDTFSDTFTTLDQAGVLDIIAKQAGPLGDVLLNLSRSFQSVIKQLEELRGQKSPVPNFDDEADGAGGYNENIEKVVSNILRINDATQLWIEEGLTNARLQIQQLRITEIEPLEDSINRAMREAGVEGALQFGDALVDAATGAEVSFKRFFIALLRDLARAIVRALILQRIINSIGLFGGGGGGGGTATASAGGTGSNNIGSAFAGSYQHGGIIPDSAIFGQPLIARVHPGEAVLPRDLTDMLLDRARGGGGGGVFNIFAMDGNDVERVLVNHPGAVSAGIAHARRRGELDG